MALQISYVERLADVLEPVREFLSRDGDLFARPRIVVPNAGTKAWLQDKLARKLGTSGGLHPHPLLAALRIPTPLRSACRIDRGFLLWCHQVD